jgi:hypothetical protein
MCIFSAIMSDRATSRESKSSTGSSDGATTNSFSSVGSPNNRCMPLVEQTNRQNQNRRGPAVLGVQHHHEESAQHRTNIQSTRSREPRQGRVNSPRINQLDRPGRNVERDYEEIIPREEHSQCIRSRELRQGRVESRGVNRVTQTGRNAQTVRPPKWNVNNARPAVTISNSGRANFNNGEIHPVEFPKLRAEILDNWRNLAAEGINYPRVADQDTWNTQAVPLATRDVISPPAEPVNVPDNSVDLRPSMAHQAAIEKRARNREEREQRNQEALRSQPLRSHFSDTTLSSTASNTERRSTA